MKTKHTFTLFIIAVILGAAAYWYSQKEEKMLETAAPVTKPVFTGITSATVERIEIKVPDSELVVLTKQDGVWYTDIQKKHKADPNLISSLFSTLEKEVTGEVVSDTPEHYADYQVNETSATHVKVLGREGKVIVELYVGKAGSSFFTTFVRKAGEKEVLSANASLTYVFNKPEGWRDKKVFDFAVDDIVDVRGELTSGILHVKKEGGVWKLYEPAPGEAVSTKIHPFISSIANLRATSFAELDSSHTLAYYGLEPPKEKLVVTYEDKSTSPSRQKTVTLLISEPKTENGLSYYYAKRGDSDDIIKLTEYQAKMLSPDPKDMILTTSTPTPSTSATTSSVAQTSSTQETKDAETTSTASEEKDKETSPTRS
jgi:hypothetical protein